MDKPLQLQSGQKPPRWIGAQCGKAEFLAATPDETFKGEGKGAGKFKMVVYAGNIFGGHWYYGDVLLDLAGFKPTRQDIPAMVDHGCYSASDYTVGACDSIKVEGDQIVCTGWILAGTLEEEPAANQVLRRLKQGFPFQASGRWEPEPDGVEQILKGAKVTVNGKEYEGPLTIFRKFSVREVSFVPLGWDEQTEAVAAAAQDHRVAPAATSAGATKKDQTMNILATLKNLFGGDRAIELHTAKPDATTIDAFLPDVEKEITTLRASIETLKAENGTLKTDLAAAKAAPAVKSLETDPNQPTKVEAAAGDLTKMTPEQLRAHYDATPALRAEFKSFEIFTTAVNSGIITMEAK